MRTIFKLTLAIIAIVLLLTQLHLSLSRYRNIVIIKDSVPIQYSNHTFPTNSTSSLKPSMQVHSLWVGDITKLSRKHINAWEKEHNLTIHTSIDEIFDGMPNLWKKVHDTCAPLIVQTDYLKLVMLYKYAGVVTDIDTTPKIPVKEWRLSDACDFYVGVEYKTKSWSHVEALRERRNALDQVRPFQILAWTYYVKYPRNKHVLALIEQAGMRIMGRQNVDLTAVQEIAGSGMATDYIAYLFEKHGFDYVEEIKKLQDGHTLALDGLCVMNDHFRGRYVTHHFLNSWR